MINKKMIIMMDIVLVVGTLLIVAGFVGYSRPLVIAPLDGLSITENSVLFEFEKGEKILIDDNVEFTSPNEYFVKDNLVINLKPGKYYWKIVGLTGSETRELTIESEIDIKLIENGEVVSVLNSGNSRLNVDIYNNGVLTGNLIVDVDDSKEVDGDKFIGRKDGS